MKVIASEARFASEARRAKQSRPFYTDRLPRRPDKSGLLAMTKTRFFREKAILLDALKLLRASLT
jgi:hypothetical protein